MLTQESALKPLLKILARGTPRSQIVVMKILRNLLSGTDERGQCTALKLVDSCLPSEDDSGPKFEILKDNPGVGFAQWIIYRAGQAVIAPAIASLFLFLSEK